MITSTALTEMGVRHYVVVEPSQEAEYKEAILAKNLAAEVLVMDLDFKRQYEVLDSFGLSKSTGPGPARNWAWWHSVSIGSKWHWVMDDNIKGFFRLNHNLKVPCKSPRYWEAMEDFVLRFANVAMAGPNYFMFASRKSAMRPFTTNTRIYSCNFIRNSVPNRWRGRYNEDTILSLDLLSAGWCTIQFNAFLQYKMQTQHLKGGNTEEFYHKEGRKTKGAKYADLGTTAKSEMLARVYPQIAKVKHRFGRVHHVVDYSQWRTRKLVLKPGQERTGCDNYGMELKMVEERKAKA